MTNVRSQPAARPLAWQPRLAPGAPAAPAADPAFRRLRRHHLDATSWVDLHPEWVAGADALFADILARAPWEEPDVPMYGHLVRQPRLTAWFGRAPGDPVLPPAVAGIAAALSARYGVDFDGVGVSLYRDGADSVAWHGDRVARRVRDPIVAVVSLGAPRPFLLRPRAGGRSTRFVPGPGDLLVMGGRCQHDWQHTVPKVSAAGPRISLTLRHSS